MINTRTTKSEHVERTAIRNSHIKDGVPDNQVPSNPHQLKKHTPCYSRFKFDILSIPFGLLLLVHSFIVSFFLISSTHLSYMESKFIKHVVIIKMYNSLSNMHFKSGRCHHLTNNAHLHYQEYIQHTLD